MRSARSARSRRHRSRKQPGRQQRIPSSVETELRQTPAERPSPGAILDVGSGPGFLRNEIHRVADRCCRTTSVRTPEIDYNEKREQLSCNVGRDRTTRIELFAREGGYVVEERSPPYFDEQSRPFFYPYPFRKRHRSKPGGGSLGSPSPSPHDFFANDMHRPSALTSPCVRSLHSPHFGSLLGLKKMHFEQFSPAF